VQKWLVGDIPFNVKIWWILRYCVVVKTSSLSFAEIIRLVQNKWIINRSKHITEFSQSKHTTWSLLIALTLLTAHYVSPQCTTTSSSLCVTTTSSLTPSLCVTATSSLTRLPSKIALRLKKVCYKVSLCENCQQQSCRAFIGVTIRAKMIGGERPLKRKFCSK